MTYRNIGERQTEIQLEELRRTQFLNNKWTKECSQCQYNIRGVCLSFNSVLNEVMQTLTYYSGLCDKFPKKSDPKVNWLGCKRCIFCEMVEEDQNITSRRREMSRLYELKCRLKGNISIMYLEHPKPAFSFIVSKRFYGKLSLEGKNKFKGCRDFLSELDLYRIISQIGVMNIGTSVMFSLRGEYCFLGKDKEAVNWELMEHHDYSYSPHFIEFMDEKMELVQLWI